MKEIIRFFACFLALIVGIGSMTCLVLSFESSWFIIPAIALALVFVNMLDSFEDDVEKYSQFLRDMYYGIEKKF